MTDQNQLKEIMEEIVVFLPKLAEACDTTATLLYEPVTEETWRQLGEIVEGMDDLYKTVNAVLDSLQGDNTGLQLLTMPLSRAVNAINDKFKAMNVCVDEEDYDGAGDVIKYEWIPLLQELIAELGELESVRERRFDANMRFLNRYYPQIHDRMRAVICDAARYRFSYARNAMPNLSLLKDGQRTVQLHSGFDPAHEADRWVELLAGKVEHKSKILMYGIGFGYLVRHYAAKYPEHRLYLYEPDEQIFLHALYAIDMASLIEGLNIGALVVGMGTDRQEELLERFSHEQGEPEVVALPVYKKLFQAHHDAFVQDAWTTCTHYANFLFNHNKYGITWTRNGMYNINSVLTTPSIQGLQDRYKGMTAVVVGAGPSLEQDIESLRKLKAHALIIAAGSTIQSLLHFGIEPHLIVAVDGTEANYNVFKDLPIDHIPMLYAPIIEHRIIEGRAGRSIHVHVEGDTVLQYLMGITTEDTVFRSSHSVTGTAIQAAIYMGCKEIVFTGQDLSYPSDNMYAPGAKHLPEQATVAVVREAELQVESVRGTINRTDQGMKLTLHNIEQLLELFTNISFVNTSKQGAKIKHTVWQSMEEVLQRLQDQLVNEDLVADALSDLQGYDAARVKVIIERVVKLPEQLQEYGRIVKGIERQIQKLPQLVRMQPNKCQKTIEEIDSTWERVTKSSPFKALWLRACRAELKQFEVELPKLTAAVSLKEQVTFYNGTMSPLLATMSECVPELMTIAVEARTRVASAFQLA
ncbi:hypothetical protein DFQ01_10169 [Paenibacillus cellulosilyticus]|uniref:DUF115 domain-containing protein n=1 Tax=Paenibacillus cellulosilyticus TaxID=375489 RepID=A0A2V2YZD8_9BACL|nr:6-hydroxymethylpterin diphosphokinase MptE-like protein [Paenibacillus cellulosilyticus]PWW08348.1 hypothetical protein DFQ01_10169 [Paenibacillus cellulosilyticus]QKS47946.1 motility associated factor glycosyltransferase family protein [Paenibacillus cellulosilyticus]